MYEMFIYFGYLSLSGHIICKNFLPFSRCLFIFCWFLIIKFYIFLIDEFASVWDWFDLLGKTLEFFLFLKQSILFNDFQRVRSKYWGVTVYPDSSVLGFFYLIWYHVKYGKFNQLYLFLWTRHFYTLFIWFTHILHTVLIKYEHRDSYSDNQR